MNGFDAGKADLSHDRGRCGFNVAARMELLFRTTPSRPYMDVELGLLNLNWKKHYAHHISDFQTGEKQTTTKHSDAMPITCIYPYTSAIVGP